MGQEGELLPGPLTAPPVDVGTGAAGMMGAARAGAGGDEPGIRIGGVYGEAPGVVAISAFVGRGPGLAAVMAPRGASATGFIRAVSNGGMPGEGMDVGLCAGPMIQLGLTAIRAVHQSAELDSNQQDLGIVGTGRNPSDVRGPRPRREAPGMARRDGLQGFELFPVFAFIAAAEEPAGLRAGVNRAIHGADGHGEDVFFGEVAADPGLAVVTAFPEAVAHGAGEENGLMRMTGQTLRAAAGHGDGNLPVRAILRCPRHAVTGGYKEL